MEFFIPWWGKAKLIVAAIVGSVAGGMLVFVYLSIFTIPAKEKAAAKVAQAEMLEKFNEASNELASDAEKFRLNRIACRSAGRVFDFSTGDCRQD